MTSNTTTASDAAGADDSDECAHERELSHLYKRVRELEEHDRIHVELRIEMERWIAELEKVLPALPLYPSLAGYQNTDIGRLNYDMGVTLGQLRRIHEMKRERDDIQF